MSALVSKNSPTGALQESHGSNLTTRLTTMTGTSAILSPSTTSLARIITAQSSTHSQNLATDTDIASMIIDQAITPPTKSENFRVRALGDRYVVMMPPQWLVKSKKNSRLSFSVSRDELLLPHQLLHIFEGVYALQIPKDEAYGVLGVKVWTDVRPIVDESFEVDFGSSWLNAASWRKAARMVTESIQSDALRVQHTLFTASSNAISMPLMSLQRTKDLLRQRKLEMGVIEQIMKTRNLALLQRRKWSRCISSRVYDSAMTASVRMNAIKGLIQQQKLGLSAKVNARSIPRQVAKLQAYFHTWIRERLTKLGPDGRSTSLRGFQKSSLKFWWRLRGLPERKTSIVQKLEGRHRKRLLPAT